VINDYVDIAFDEAKRGNLERFILILIDVADRSVHSKIEREQLDTYVKQKLEESKLRIGGA